MAFPGRVPCSSNAVPTTRWCRARCSTTAPGQVIIRRLLPGRRGDAHLERRDRPAGAGRARLPPLRAGICFMPFALAFVVVGNIRDPAGALIAPRWLILGGGVLVLAAMLYGSTLDRHPVYFPDPSSRSWWAAWASGLISVILPLCAVAQVDPATLSARSRRSPLMVYNLGGALHARGHPGRADLAHAVSRRHHRTGRDMTAQQLGALGPATPAFAAVGGRDRRCSSVSSRCSSVLLRPVTSPRPAHTREAGGRRTLEPRCGEPPACQTVVSMPGDRITSTGSRTANVGDGRSTRAQPCRSASSCSGDAGGMPGRSTRWPFGCSGTSLGVRTVVRAGSALSIPLLFGGTVIPGRRRLPYTVPHPGTNATPTMRSRTGGGSRTCPEPGIALARTVRRIGAGYIELELDRWSTATARADGKSDRHRKDSEGSQVADMAREPGIRPPPMTTTSFWSATLPGPAESWHGALMERRAVIDDLFRWAVRARPTALSYHLLPEPGTTDSPTSRRISACCR